MCFFSKKTVCTKAVNLAKITAAVFHLHCIKRETGDVTADTAPTEHTCSNKPMSAEAVCVKGAKGKRATKTKPNRSKGGIESSELLGANDADYCVPVKKRLAARNTKKEDDTLLPPAGGKKHRPALPTKRPDEVGDQTHGISERTSVAVGTRKTVLRRFMTRNGRGMDWVLQQCTLHETISQHRGFGFTKTDLLLLDDGWLNSKIIDFYLELLQLRNQRHKASNPLSEFRISQRPSRND